MGHAVKIHNKTGVAVAVYTEAAQQLIPHARRIDRNGHKFLLVPAKKEEMQLLRNLGYDSPSPLRGLYNFNNIEPFEAQVVTTDLLIHSPRAYVLNDFGCVDADTEYLSPTGWQRIADYSGGSVAQYHPDTGGAEFVAPKEFIKKPCHRMLHIKNNHGLDQMLSKEHRVLIQAKDRRSKHETISAAELFSRALAWEQGNKLKRSTSQVGFSQSVVPTAFSMDSAGRMELSDDEMRIMVAVIADGHFPNPCSTCEVRLKKERKQYRLRVLLNNAGVKFTETPCLPDGFLRFAFTAPRREKGFTSDWYSASPAQRLLIADEVAHWGKHTKGLRHVFSTTVKESADFIQFVFCSLRITCRVCTNTRERRGRIETEYVVTPRDCTAVGICGTSGDGGRRINMKWVPSTDGYKYCFVVPSAYLVFRRNGCVFLSGNTGKTLSALFAFDYLRKQGLVRKMLVIAPLSTLTSVWAREVFMRMGYYSTSVIHGTADKRKKLLAIDADIYIINHHGSKTVVNELIAKHDIDVVVIDELAVFRNKRTDLWKYANAVCAKRKFVWGMTGSPTPKDPCDAWAQVKLLTPNNVPPFFKRFKESVMHQVSTFRWIAKKDANDIVFNAMQPAVRFTRADCVDLPPTTYSTREVALSTMQQKVFNSMKDQYYAEFKQGTITAANEGVKVSKLLQICCGFAYGEDGLVVPLENKARTKVIIDVLEESEASVLLFSPFKRSVDILYDKLLALGYDTSRVYGDTSKNERDKIFNRFQNTPGKRVLVAHPQTLAHGLTLTAANTVVWDGPPMSLEIYEQANARVPRPGQKLTTHVIHIQSTALESKYYRRLESKAKIQGALLEMFEEGDV